MDKEKLSKWAEQLLDTGKRNNLINFKDTRLGSVEILAPELGSIFSKAEHSATFEIYDPKIKTDDDIDHTEEDIGKVNSKEDYFAKHAKKIKKSAQILAYNPYSSPITAIKNIGKRAKSAIEETGVNIAYMAFGFINWFEEKHPEDSYLAPVLLVPVTIENQSAISPCYVKVIDDEIIVNPTFSFKLHNEFGITLPEFIDQTIEEYLASVEQAISKLNWKVERLCKIGIFSFLKINMYMDLKENADTILQNKDVRALLGESELASDKARTQIQYNHISPLSNVVDADASQAEAIEMARDGKSFVLQGPPGTGKSQTITNIIAECLANGKKVLFVSEKLAALNVVYDKLKKAGLAEFCLELHSHKANKKDVIDELTKTLRLQKSAVSNRAIQEFEVKERAKRELDDYVVELHGVRPIIEKSLYDIYQEISACRNAPDYDFIINGVNEKGEDYLSAIKELIENYAQYTFSIGEDYRQNVWYGYSAQDCSYEFITNLKLDLATCKKLAHELLSLDGEVYQKFGFNLASVKASKAMRELLSQLVNSEFLLPCILDAEKLNFVKIRVDMLLEQAIIASNEKSALLKFFDQDIFNIDGGSYHKKLTKQFSGGGSRLFSLEYKRMMKEIKLCVKNGNKLNYTQAVSYMKYLSNYQQALKEFDKEKVDIENYFSAGALKIDIDFDKLKFQLSTLEKCLAEIKELGKIKELTAEQLVSKKPELKDICNRLSLALDNGQDAFARVSTYFNPVVYDFNSVGLSALEQKIIACQNNIDKIDNWCEFNKLIILADTLDIKEYIDFAIDNKIAIDNIYIVYKKAFLMQWVDIILREAPLLSKLSRIPHDQAVEIFKEKDELNFEINKAKIKASLSATRPNLDIVAQGSAIAILLRESEKKRKQKNIRVLLSEIADLALTLKPCFLMSPLSISTFLSPNINFDVVVFDEASQIFPQDAIGAIYRGKQLIVVGDSKQMPPSNFFNAMAEVNDDDEEDVTDFESILDICSTTLPQRRLKWHYRSKNEELITFSNKNFYDNDLVTFPSAKKDQVGAGIDYIYVDGTFDRSTKTNRKEAERIVDLVFENIKKYPNRSLGVVAFSISQQNLIDKLIYKRRQQELEYEEFFSGDNKEPFFVKNLETVQGDERDTIIFSVAYAKDAQGKLLLNFGPINREGGERRLNVAVTRAKINVQLVSSMRYTDIDLSRTKSVGARLLKEYLEFAEKGEMPIATVSENGLFTKDVKEVEKEICEFLTQNGYIVDTEVGRSALKIDLAVKGNNTGDYVLAIECDGATYRASKSARDRDRLRQSVLENMGWKYYRIWSVDWFKNKQVEKEKLLQVVKDAVSGSGKKPKQSKKPDENLSFAEVAVTKHFEFDKYKMADEEKTAKANKNNIPLVISAIVELEAPISEEWLLKRILFMFGKQKVTPQVKEEYEKYLLECKNYNVMREDGFLYLLGKPVPSLRVPADKNSVRDIKYIALKELSNGIKDVLKQNLSVTKEGLFRMLSEQLGYARLTETAEKRLEQALEQISNFIEIKNNALSFI